MSENQDNKDNSIGLSRRDALRAGAAGSVAAAAGGAGAAASADSVKADTGSFVYAPTAPDRVGLAAAKGIGSVLDWVSDSNAEDLTILHREAVSEMESYDAHIVNVDNTLTDTDTMANLEAREAIARAWEDGKDEGEAFNEALSAINNYYAERLERNHIEITAKSLNQYSNLAKRALDWIIEGDRDLDDTDMALWNFVATPDHPEDGYNLSWVELTDERVDAEFELVNGNVHITTMPEIRFEWNNDEWQGTVAEMDYTGDPGFESFEFETDEGYTATWSGSIIIPNIPDADLSGYVVLRLDRDFEYWRDEIDSQASSVIGNYDEGFVGDLYDALDAETISPNELRGVDGQARFLSGDADVASDSYQLALYQQLNMEQPDLEEIASMTVEFDGMTDWFREPNEDGNIEQQYPQERVDNRPMEGLLFSRQIDDLEVNQRIQVGHLLHDDGKIYYDFDENKEPFDPEIEEFDTVEYYNDSLYYLGDGQSYKIDFGDDEPEEFDYIGYVEDSYTTLDKLVWVGESGLYEYDGESINQLTEHGYDSIESASCNQNGFAVCNDEEVTVWNLDGEEQYTEEIEVGDQAEIGYITEGYAIPITTVYGDLESYTYTLDESGVITEVTEAESRDSSSSQYLGSVGRLIYGIDHGWNSGGAGTFHRSCITGGWIQPDGSLENTFETTISQNISSVDIERDLVNEEFRIKADWVADDDYDHEVSGVYDLSGNRLSDIDEDAELSSTESLIYLDNSNQAIPRFSTFYDALESEEVSLTLGQLTIESMTDTDGEKIKESDGWSDPEYDQFNVDEFLEYLEDSEEYQETLQRDEYWSPPDLPGVPGSDDLIPDIPRWAWLIPGGALAYALLSD